MTNLKEKIARAICPVAWDKEEIMDCYYPAAKRRIEEMQANSLNQAQAALEAMISGLREDGRLIAAKLIQRAIEEEQLKAAIAER